MKIKIVLGPVARKTLLELGSADAREALQMLVEGTNVKHMGTYNITEGETERIVKKLAENAGKIRDKYMLRLRKRLIVTHRKKDSAIIIQAL